MMYKVYKYPLNNLSHQPTWVELPLGAKLLHVNWQGDPNTFTSGEFVLWALVDITESEREQRCIMVKGTGWEIRTGTVKYINTFSTGSAQYWWHAFELYGVLRDPSTENDHVDARASTTTDTGHATPRSVRGKSLTRDLHSHNGS
jgi:hypothetical protein